MRLGYQVGCVVTINTAVIVVVVYIPDAACIAVITLEPMPTIVTVRPLIVATDCFSLVNVNDPGLFDDGSIKLNDESPYFFVGIIKLARVGIVVIANNAIMQ
jgi:hypothetical protein